MDGFFAHPITLWVIRLIGVAIALFAGWAAARLAAQFARRGMERARFDPMVAGFLANAVRWAIIAMVVVACIGALGFATTSFAAILGAAGLAVGLALQGTLGSLAAGVLLLVLRPFRVGDVIRAAGEIGKVVEVTLFTTLIDTADNRRIIVPNKAILDGNIENITHHERRRVDVDVGVEYAADLDRTREVLMAAIAAVPGALTDPAPDVALMNLGASSVDWQVRVWAPAPDWFAVKQATIRAVKMALDEAGLGIPFPQMDVHFPDGKPVA